jgi:CubicO group peptidase (beta-lactamase class C family)
MRRLQLPSSSYFIKLSLAALLLGAATPLALAQEEGLRKDALQAQVDKIFAPWDKPDSPGCALAVIKDGKVIYQRGYGLANLDHDIPIAPATVFHVASVSKQFTAMAILLLAQQGKLALDDEVRKQVPELPDFGAPLTIRHLMHHTSGLRDQWNLLIMAGWRLSEDVVREEDILELIARQKALNFKPGDQHLYSNTGYTLMAVIVRRVSGQSLREFTEAQIFKPLGMTRTFFRDDHAVIVKNQAYGYRPAPGGGFRFSVPNYDTVGASSLLTTVEDLARWDQNFYDAKVGGAQLIAQMQNPGTLNSGEKIEYALGLSVSKYKGLRVVEHGGSDAGYRSTLTRFPEQRFSVACLCNLASINPGQLARRVADVYLADQLTPDAPRENHPANAVKLSEQELAGKAGVYWNAVTEDLARVTLNNGKLYLTGAAPNAELVPLGENRFQVTGQPGEVTFESPRPGSPLRLIITPEGRKPLVYEYAPASALTPAQWAEYAGTYYSEELDAAYKVVCQDDKLAMHRKKFRPAPLQPAFNDAFSGPGVGTIRFIRDAQNRVTGFLLSSGRIRNFRFVKQPQ